MPITLPFALCLHTPSMWMAINFYVGNAVRLDKSIFSKMMLQLIHLEGEPGHLIMCDAKDCPFSFHFVCAGMSKEFIPEGACCYFDHNNCLGKILPHPGRLIQATGFVQNIHLNILLVPCSGTSLGSLSCVASPSTIQPFKDPFLRFLTA